MTVIPVSDRFVRQIRVAEPEHRTRVVLDLAEDADATISRLDNPSRLIIEVRGRTGWTLQANQVTSLAPAPAQPAPKGPWNTGFVPPPNPVTVLFQAGG